MTDIVEDMNKKDKNEQILTEDEGEKKWGSIDVMM